MSECIRRPESYWTFCTCANCRRLSNKRSKAWKAGIKPDPRLREKAAGIFQGWLAAGWDSGAIASATGLDSDAVLRLRRDVKADRWPRVVHATARRIVAAEHAFPTAGNVGAIGTTRRLRALACLGWGLLEVSERTGVNHRTLACIRQGRYTGVGAPIARRVNLAYEQLSMNLGPSARARSDAQRHGWLPPLAWDDDAIDDPAAEPYTDREIRPGGRHIHVEDIEFVLTDAPVTTTKQLAERFGCTPDGIQHACRRAGRADLLAKLARNAELAA